MAGERRRNIIGGSSHVILVLGYSATISDTDYTQSAQIISRFKTEIPGNDTFGASHCNKQYSKSSRFRKQNKQSYYIEKYSGDG
jgi:hypothetical protein